MVRWNIAALVGVPGVGKTSLCISAARALNYVHVNYGELMLDIASTRNLASNQNEMFELDFDIQYSIWKEAACEISRISAIENNILVDLHGVDPSLVGYIVSLPFEILNPDVIIIIESSYKNIMMRRKADEYRTRPIEGVNKLCMDMDILRSSMVCCSVMCGSYLNVVENNNFEKCLNELEDILG